MKEEMSPFFSAVAELAVSRGFEVAGVNEGALTLNLNGDFAAMVDETGAMNYHPYKEVFDMMDEVLKIRAEIPYDNPEEAFRDIVKLCEQYGEKVVSVHSLKSANTVIEILREYKTQRSNKYIFHWFTGSIPQLEKVIELGCYFSINPRMLKTKSGIEVVKTVPISRMLLETDIPFTFTVHYINEIEKELKRTVTMISDIVEFDVTDIIYKNSKEVFRY